MILELLFPVKTYVNVDFLKVWILCSFWGQKFVRMFCLCISWHPMGSCLSGCYGIGDGVDDSDVDDEDDDDGDDNDGGKEWFLRLNVVIQVPTCHHSHHRHHDHHNHHEQHPTCLKASSSPRQNIWKVQDTETPSYLKLVSNAEVLIRTMPGDHQWIF